MEVLTAEERKFVEEYRASAIQGALFCVLLHSSLAVFHCSCAFACVRMCCVRVTVCGVRASVLTAGLFLSSLPQKSSG